MQYRTIVDGRFIDRPNRFVAHVEIDGTTQTVHVKNTGRCRELLLPGADVRLEVCDDPKRKTKYDLVAVYKPGLGWVNLDSQAPNKVVWEWLSTQGFDLVRPEYPYGDSRIDFYMEKNAQLNALCRGQHRVDQQRSPCRFRVVFVHLHVVHPFVGPRLCIANSVK